MKAIDFETILENSKLDYFSDISWGYSYDDGKVALDFFQDEVGRNNVEQFCKNIKGVWFSITPTQEQIKKMWDKLNKTPYREVEKGYDYDTVTDLYYENGVTRESFY